jgi:hypothetical protein
MEELMVGQDFILRPIFNRPVRAEVQASSGRLKIGRQDGILPHGD